MYDATYMCMTYDVDNLYAVYTVACIDACIQWKHIHQDPVRLLDIVFKGQPTSKRPNELHITRSEHIAQLFQSSQSIFIASCRLGSCLGCMRGGRSCGAVANKPEEVYNTRDASYIS